MISRFLEALYTKVFINIVVENSRTNVYVEVCSKDNVLKIANKVFDTVSMNSKMFEFIKSYSKESPFYYVSILDKSSAQGAVPTCANSEMGKYFDIAASKYKCYSKSWAYYTSEYDLESIKHEYRSIGVDFIFSPYVLIANFFKDKINSTLAMFVLVEENYLSLTVFDNSKLLYAEYLDMQHKEEDDTLMIDTPLDDDEDEMLFGLDETGGIDLEEIEIDDNHSIEFDDFSDIEDLDSGDTIDEFSEEKDIEEIINKEKDTDVSSGFNEDYQRFSLIQSSLNTFYRDPKYDSKFIETIYIADGVGISSDLKNYFEEEMFLNVYVRKIDIAFALCDTAKAEVNAI